MIDKKDLELKILLKECKIQQLELKLKQIQNRIDLALEILEDRINFDYEQIKVIFEVVRILRGENNE